MHARPRAFRELRLRCSSSCGSVHRRRTTVPVSTVVDRLPHGASGFLGAADRCVFLLDELLGLRHQVAELPPVGRQRS